MTPTQSFVAAAEHIRDITDASGRILTIRRPSTLDRLHLFKAVGPTLAANDRYLGLAMLGVHGHCNRRRAYPTTKQRASDRGRHTASWRRCRERDRSIPPPRRHGRLGCRRHGKLSKHPDLVDSLYLVHNGVPFDVAFSLDRRERLHWIAVIGEFHGRIFDWSSERWVSLD